MNILLRCWKENSGQDLVEYGLIALLISTLTIGIIQGSGTAISGVWDRITSSLNAAL